MSNSTPALKTPSVKRRLICMVYEAFLLVAVEMLVTLVFLLVTQNRHSPIYDHARNFVLFLALAAYFIHFWTDSGHTLAMKTWRIKVVKPAYARLPPGVAAKRFLLGWGWFLPALAVCHAFGINSKSGIGITVLLGVIAWALTAFADSDRQFLHDRLLGTRLVLLPEPAKKQKQAVAPDAAAQKL
ncbi:MAG TPA: RDD family protein [Janthinobacterium sp.]|jgi:uncharacterized RDD family membrane protein YckC|nr:RDD family protein [Janthinobacterium sp.]